MEINDGKKASKIICEYVNRLITTWILVHPKMTCGVNRLFIHVHVNRKISVILSREMIICGQKINYFRKDLCSIKPSSQFIFINNWTNEVW
jgi:hypothetical protein